MKSIYLISLLFITFISCDSQNKYDYKIENQYYDCFIKNTEGKNIEEKINKIEKTLIKYKVLKSKEGKSYIDFFKSLNDIDDFSILVSENLIEELSKIKNLPERIVCLDTTILYDTVSIKKSRMFALKNAWVELLSAGDINNSLISYVALKHLKEEDFNHKFFKTMFLLTINKFILNLDVLSGTNIGLQRKLPPINETVEAKKRNIMIVFVNSKNEIFINDQKITIAEINQRAKIFLLNPNNNKNLPEKKELDLAKVGKTKVSKGIISLQTERLTHYEKYLQVQNELVRAINELRDDFAKEHFNIPYEELPEEKQEIVGKAIPLCITEAEPRRMTNE